MGWVVKYVERAYPWKRVWAPEEWGGEEVMGSQNQRVESMGFYTPGLAPAQPPR